jgi:Fe-S cluster biogenesis protein NfuA
MYHFDIENTDQKERIRLCSDKVLSDKTVSFQNIDDATDYPLVQQLFYLPFVKSVQLTPNHIELERFSILEWSEVQEEVKDQITNFLNQGGLIEKTSQPKAAVTVYAESTPNPAVMKFVANKLLVTQSFEAKNIDEAQGAPLALALFHMPFVKEVYIDENFVSVSKFEVASWEEVVQDVRNFIRDFLIEGKSVVDQVQNVQALETEQPQHEGVSLEIVKIIDQYIKPAVASDGGNIVFDSYDASTQSVQVILQGACSGCPSSTFTLKNGIEQMLKEMLPGKVTQVTALNG